MALIKCPKCGKKVSENAKKCPKCGEPIKTQNTLEIINNKKKELKEIIKKIKSDEKKKKKTILCIATIIIVVCVIIAFSSSRKVKTADFKNRLESVVSKNENLSDLTFEKDDSSVRVYVDDEPIGFYFIGNKKYIKTVIGTVSEETISSEYQSMMIAAFLSLDSKLNYDEAKKIADKLDDNCLYEEDDEIIKNGIEYKWNCDETISSDNGTEFSAWVVTLAKDSTK